MRYWFENGGSECERASPALFESEGSQTGQEKRKKKKNQRGNRQESRQNLFFRSLRRDYNDLKAAGWSDNFKTISLQNIENQ